MGVDHKVQIGRRKQFSATELSAMVLRSLKADAEADLGGGTFDGKTHEWTIDEKAFILGRKEIGPRGVGNQDHR